MIKCDWNLPLLLETQMKLEGGQIYNKALSIRYNKIKLRMEMGNVSKRQPVIFLALVTFVIYETIFALTKVFQINFVT